MCLRPLKRSAVDRQDVLRARREGDHEIPGSKPSFTFSQLSSMYPGTTGTSPSSLDTSKGARRSRRLGRGCRVSRSARHQDRPQKRLPHLPWILLPILLLTTPRLVPNVALCSCRRSIGYLEMIQLGSASAF